MRSSQMDLIKSSRNATNSIQIDIFVGIWSIFLYLNREMPENIFYVHDAP